MLEIILVVIFEKIEMYEEIYILFVNIELNKKIYDVVEI